MQLSAINFVCSTLDESRSNREDQTKDLRMVALSQLKKNELYEYAVDAGFTIELEETNRHDLIQYLRDHTSLAAPSQVNRKPNIEKGNPSITCDGKKIKPVKNFSSDAGKTPALSHIVDEVRGRTQEIYGKEHLASVADFWDIASLVISACQQPDSLTMSTIVTFRASAITTKFNAICLRSIMALMRDHPRQYGSAIQCAILDTVKGLAGDDEAGLRHSLICEIRKIKGLESEPGEPDTDDDAGDGEPDDESGEIGESGDPEKQSGPDVGSD